MDNNIPVSSVVLSQFPEFAYPKYSKFIAFIELYYQFIEQSKFKSFDNITSIDNNIDEFVEHIKYQLGINLPNTNSTDDAFFLHHIKEFYSTKGTEESFRILFRHLFGKEIDIAYPKDLILKASDGKWQQDVSVVVDVVSGNPFSFSGNFVTIHTPQKQFDVFCSRVKLLPNDTFEVFLDPFYYSDVSVNDLIIFGDAKTIIKPCLSSYKIVKSGFKFKEGQIFNVSGGEGQKAKIKVLKTGANGSLQKIQIFDFGYGFKSSFFTNVVSQFTDAVVTDFPNVANSTTGFIEDLNFFHQQYFIDYAEDSYTGEIFTSIHYDYSADPGTIVDEENMAVIEFNVNVLQRYPGFYSTSESFLSDSYVTQDNRFFQLYSYVIKISENIDVFKDIVKRLLNPAGFAMFSEYSVSNEMDMSGFVDSAVLIFKRMVFDKLHVSDLESLWFNKFLDDAIGYTEYSQWLFNKSLTDTITPSYNYSFDISKYLEDDLTFSDIATIITDYHKTYTDTINIQDTRNYFNAYNDENYAIDYFSGSIDPIEINYSLDKSIQDNINVSESFNIIAERSKALADSISVNGSGQYLNIYNNENYATDYYIEELLNVEAVVLTNKLLQDTVSLTESITISKLYGKNYSDTITINELSNTTFNKSLFDSITVDDSQLDVYKSLHPINDSISNIEQTSLLLGKSLSDTVNKTEQQSKRLSKRKTESVTAQIQNVSLFSKSSNDTQQLLDAGSIVLNNNTLSYFSEDYVYNYSEGLQLTTF